MGDMAGIQKLSGTTVCWANFDFRGALPSDSPEIAKISKFLVNEVLNTKVFQMNGNN